jgi:hypothetical protein
MLCPGRAEAAPRGKGGGAMGLDITARVLPASANETN